MKKFLLILIGLVISLSSYSQKTYPEYQVDITFSSFIWRYEMTSDGKLLKDKQGPHNKKITKTLKVISYSDDNLLFCYNDSSAYILYANSDLVKLVKKNKVKNLWKKDKEWLDNFQTMIIRKIDWLYEQYCIEIERKEAEKEEHEKHYRQIMRQHNDSVEQTIAPYRNQLKIYEDSINYINVKLAELSDIKKIKNVQDFYLIYEEISVNSVGGTGPAFTIINGSQKSIKYISFTTKFYNRVNDIISDRITGNSLSTWTIQGPINYLEKDWLLSSSWSSLFYNGWAEYFKITSMTITYMNGTTKTYTAKQIANNVIESESEMYYNPNEKEIQRLKKQKQIYENKIDEIKNIIKELAKDLQTSITDENGDKIYFTTACMPEYPGGYGALMKYLYTHVRYPQTAADNNIQGNVVVQFVVEKNGNVGEVKIARSVSFELDTEAKRVVKSLPKFKPGRNADGDPVRVWYTLPIGFKLQGAN